MNIIRHGELVLKPIETNIKKWKDEKNYIASHSETGHHHVVMGMCQVFAEQGKNIIMRLKEETKIEHKKTHDKHKPLLVPAGDYELIRKTEYDPFVKIVREVWD